MDMDIIHYLQEKETIPATPEMDRFGVFAVVVGELLRWCKRHCQAEMSSPEQKALQLVQDLVDIHWDLRHLGLDNWPAPTSVLAQAAHMLAECGPKGRAYLELFSLSDPDAGG